MERFVLPYRRYINKLILQTILIGDFHFSSILFIRFEIAISWHISC